MVDPPLFSNSKHQDLQLGLIARDSDPSLPKDMAQRAVNYTMAEVAKAKKERKKPKKERAKL